jgi:hypothetical protein
MNECILQKLRILVITKNVRKRQVEFYKKLESVLRGYNLDDTWTKISWKYQRKYDCFKSAHDTCQSKTSYFRKRYEKSINQIDEFLDTLL